MRMYHGPIAQPAALGQVADAVLGLGPDLEVVVDHRHLTVEHEVGVRRVVLEQRQQVVEQVDQLHAERLVGLVPLPIPVGVRDDGHVTSHALILRLGLVRIAFGTDERTPLTDAVKAHLVEPATTSWSSGRAIRGPTSAGGSARRSPRPTVDRGIVCCWTGTGVTIAANKVEGVRAALCTDAETAQGARRWNDANVLALGLRLTSDEVAGEMLNAFLTTATDPSEENNIRRLG